MPTTLTKGGYDKQLISYVTPTPVHGNIDVDSAAVCSVSDMTFYITLEVSCLEQQYDCTAQIVITFSFRGIVLVTEFMRKLERNPLAEHDR